MDFIAGILIGIILTLAYAVTMFRLSEMEKRSPVKEWLMEQNLKVDELKRSGL